MEDFLSFLLDQFLDGLFWIWFDKRRRVKKKVKRLKKDPHFRSTWNQLGRRMLRDKEVRNLIDRQDIEVLLSDRSQMIQFTEALTSTARERTRKKM